MSQQKYRMLSFNFNVHSDIHLREHKITNSGLSHVGLRFSGLKGFRFLI